MCTRHYDYLPAMAKIPKKPFFITIAKFSPIGFIKRLLGGNK